MNNAVRFLFLWDAAICLYCMINFAENYKFFAIYFWKWVLIDKKKRSKLVVFNTFWTLFDSFFVKCISLAQNDDFCSFSLSLILTFLHPKCKIQLRKTIQTTISILFCCCKIQHWMLILDENEEFFTFRFLKARSLKNSQVLKICLCLLCVSLV